MLPARRIRRLVLGSYFTGVELDDGSVGAAMSYYRLRAGQLAAVSAELQVQLRSDPLLSRTLAGWRRSDALDRSLRVAIASALAAPVIRAGGDETFVASPTCPFDPFEGRRRAVVVGFGGYLRTLAAHRDVRAVHVLELTLEQRRRAIFAEIEALSARHPGVAITVSDGSDARDRLLCADVICITGSALCNGTMDGLLALAPRSARIVVQGQSASVHPAALFERGVDLAATTLKPRSLIDLLCAGRGRELLEGRIPWTYMLPRSS